MRKKSLILAGLAAVFMAGAVYAAGPADLSPEMRSLMDKYLAEARKNEPSLKAFSPEEGKKFFDAKRTHSTAKEERACSTCHTSNPAQPGKTPVGKTIDPMAHSANKDRFTDPQKVEKWFKRNCAWVLERECTPKEKGGFITYMMSN
jgi:uncharacterized protein DUF1924